MSNPGPAVPERLGAGRIIAIVLAMLLNLGLVAAVVLVMLNPQRTIDQIAVWRFEPPADIAAYADRATMTDEGRFLFFASRPEIERDAAFDRICASHLEDVGVLGCYVHADRRIHLYDVTDERLEGIEEVVAAHEMLHAAWDRMSRAEQQRLEPLLEAEVDARADDEALAQTLEFYAEAEPGERANELHSILGTEYGDLGAELESHYARYFTDRDALLALHEQSNAVFVQQQAAIEALVAQLEALSAAVDADYAAYNAGYDALNAQILAFNARAESGDFDSQSQFDQERNALLARQAELDALYASIDARAKQYDAMVVQLDALNAEVDELNESINIDPRPVTPPR